VADGDVFQFTDLDVRLECLDAAIELQCSLRLRLETARLSV